MAVMHGEQNLQIMSATVTPLRHFVVQGPIDKKPPCHRHRLLVCGQAFRACEPTLYAANRQYGDYSAIRDLGRTR